jgi:hypothetical protein
MRFPRSGAFTLNVTPGTNVTSGVGGLSMGTITLGGLGLFNIAGSESLTNTAALDGAFGITKVGAGDARARRHEQYTGATTVSNGLLLLDGGLTTDVGGQRHRRDAQGRAEFHARDSHAEPFDHRLGQART